MLFPTRGRRRMLLVDAFILARRYALIATIVSMVSSLFLLLGVHSAKTGTTSGCWTTARRYFRHRHHRRLKPPLAPNPTTYTCTTSTRSTCIDVATKRNGVSCRHLFCCGSRNHPEGQDNNLVDDDVTPIGIDRGEIVASRLGLDPSLNPHHPPFVYHEQYSFDGWPSSFTFPVRTRRQQWTKRKQ